MEAKKILSSMTLTELRLLYVEVEAEIISKAKKDKCIAGNLNLSEKNNYAEHSERFKPKKSYI
ncbi:hypothetical protein [Chromobacterium haemolyticum]|uniref:hypothetical protein n=1 Tax=Chromobacterium TaxID=535 RepID=UPI004056536B